MVSIDRLACAPTPEAITTPLEAPADVRPEVEKANRLHLTLLPEVPGQTISCDDFVAATKPTSSTGFCLTTSTTKRTSTGYGGTDTAPQMIRTSRRSTSLETTLNAIGNARSVPQHRQHGHPRPDSNQLTRFAVGTHPTRDTPRVHADEQTTRRQKTKKITHGLPSSFNFLFKEKTRYRRHYPLRIRRLLRELDALSTSCP